MRKAALHGVLFLLTLVTTTMAGAEWRYGKSFSYGPDGFSWIPLISWEEIGGGLVFSLAFLGFLTVHEFGHYVTARYYRVRVTLPYYIPVWLGFTFGIGTMGAFIRIRERIFSRKEFFDIGIAGPLAGFVVAVGLLWYGFTHLPPLEYLYEIHPQYRLWGENYAAYAYRSAEDISLGKNLLFWLFEQTVADPTLLPNRYEVMHYPVLFAGFLALFFTALNLLPIGQLDGGHILYGLLGYERFNRLSPLLFTLFIFYAGLGLLPLDGNWAANGWLYGGYVVYLLVVFRPLFPEARRGFLVAAGVLCAQAACGLLWPQVQGYNGWLVFGLLLARFMGIFHPPCPNEEPLSKGRVWLGCLAMVVFMLCFSPAPFLID
ncbi:site-2 protease family protein [Rufibacter quisquiliarum]|uniref:Membrane-associated protease RseP (Regulator of RpoE activity) n=1 Tax=Rufibacter quisquiliarum TaxID=1549639 RepID=A0A839GPS1_9BACT|nr:site-2 protease family protein [Rufibacter quisquiliarum]MBA9077525.1 membrane-associated protease RseP (regulator of RpoE activity) [Rufibacter quisquiliarum]